MRTSIKAISLSVIGGILLLSAIAYSSGLYLEQKEVKEITTYRRAGSIMIDNTYGRVPKMVFTSEEITLIPNKPPMTQFLRRSELRMGDPAEVITLKNPETGDTIGSITAAEVYAIIYSLYLHAENKADAPTMQGTN